MSNDPNKKKAKHAFSREEAVEYLRRLADQLEDGSIQVSNEEMEFEGLIKVKEELKTKKGKTSVKVQFKVSTQEMPHEDEPDSGAQPELSIDQAAPPEAEEGDEQPSSYKKLKKLMGKRFKDIGKTLEEGGQASQADIAAFCDNCLQMITFKGSKLGEDMYAQFEAAAQALRVAGESGDPAAIKEAYDGLDALKKACHKEYK